MPGIAVVRRNTEEVQGRGNFEVFEQLFAADFVDHTPQPGGFSRTATVREIYAKKLSGNIRRIIKGGTAHCAPRFLIFMRRSVLRIGRFRYEVTRTTIG